MKEIKLKRKVPMPKPEHFPTLLITEDDDIALDFATKAYEKFGKIIKSVVMFGSTAKKKASLGSDLDIIMIVDDCSVRWDQELVAWYREELGKVIKQNPYKRALHITTVRLSTWWEEMIRGEPVIINMIRYGQPLIDFGGFFTPLKVLLAQGKIKSTPESIYVMLNRAPMHLARTKMALINSVEGMYWAMVDSANAALVAAKRVPPSPEQVPALLRETFVDNRLLDKKYVQWYEELYHTTHSILHGTIKEVHASDIDQFEKKTDLFLREMAKLVGKTLK
jgi:predicted nucleotidyltransferase/uncharacterized protein (UPF0332 family)